MTIHQAIENARSSRLADGCGNPRGRNVSVFDIHNVTVNELFMFVNWQAARCGCDRALLAETSGREAMAAMAAVLVFGSQALDTAATEITTMTITCFIRYEIDLFQRGFTKYAEHLPSIPSRLKSDPEACEDAAMVQTKRLILGDEKNFV